MNWWREGPPGKRRKEEENFSSYCSSAPPPVPRQPQPHFQSNLNLRPGPHSVSPRPNSALLVPRQKLPASGRYPICTERLKKANSSCARATLSCGYFPSSGWNRTTSSRWRYCSTHELFPALSRWCRARMSRAKSNTVEIKYELLPGKTCFRVWGLRIENTHNSHPTHFKCIRSFLEEASFSRD